MGGFFYGALSMVGFLFCVYSAFRAGQRSRKPVHRETDEQQVNKAKELRKGFEDLMSYDVSKAYGKKNS